MKHQLMKNQNPSLDKSNVLTVGYSSPGWPLSQYPNGIVAYIQNITDGLDGQAKYIIFAGVAVESESEVSCIDLSRQVVVRDISSKAIDYMLNKVRLPITAPIRFKRHLTYEAQKLFSAIQQLNEPVDILEIEESFGTAQSFINLSKIPVVTRIHGPWFAMGDILKVKHEWDFKLRIAYEGEAIKNVHGVTAPSLDVLNKVREYYDIALPNAQVIANPVKEVSVEKRWRYDATKQPSILFVGRFDLIKGGDLILESFRLVALKNREVTLLFVGPDKGITKNNQLISFSRYIELFIPEENIRKRIQFLGHCNSDAIVELRRTALVTVICSRYENFPLSLLEALAAGCPTVATAVGGIKEIIKDGYNGLFAEPDSVESIADNVLRLIENLDMMETLSKNAIDDSRKRFSPKVIATQTLDYYQTVLAKPNQ